MCHWGDWRRQSVCGSHSLVSSDSTVVFTAVILHTKTKIVLGDMCTVLENIINCWRSVQQFFNAFWCYLGFPQLMMIISSVSLINVVEVKMTQYIHYISERRAKFSWMLPHPGIIQAFQQLRCAPQLTMSVSKWAGFYLLQLKGAYFYTYNDVSHI